VAGLPAYFDLVNAFDVDTDLNDFGSFQLWFNGP
jgi:hypothetical protein